MKHGCTFSGLREVSGIIGCSSSSPNTSTLSISACQNTGNITANEDYAGGIAGRQMAGKVNIANCENKSDVTGVSYVGGMVGLGNSVMNSQSAAKVIALGDYAGGIAGNLTGPIDNSTFSGTVSGVNYVGSIAGLAGTVSKCAGSVDITSTGSYIGGIVGRATSVTNCYNTKKIIGSNYTGGVAGYVSGLTDNCFNTGIITGAQYTGGVIGSSGNLQNCYNRGKVTGTDRVGGIVGNTSASTFVKSSYNTGTISGTTAYVGSLIGYKTATAAAGTPTFWLVGTAAQAVGFGTQIPAPVMDTSAVLKTRAIDLGAAWSDASGNENDGYPVLNAFAYANGLLFKPIIHGVSRRVLCRIKETQLLH